MGVSCHSTNSKEHPVTVKQGTHPKAALGKAVTVPRNKGKAYAARRHRGSLCTQKQPGAVTVATAERDP